jgi:hypothetical protein
LSSSNQQQTTSQVKPALPHFGAWYSGIDGFDFSGVEYRYLVRRDLANSYLCSPVRALAKAWMKILLPTQSIIAGTVHAGTRMGTWAF